MRFSDQSSTADHTDPSPPGRSILDYSIVGCFVLIFLLVFLLLDAYEYVTVPAPPSPARGRTGRTIDSNVVESARERGAIMEAMTASASKEDLEDAERDIDAAKAILAKTRAEVEIVVDKIDDNLKEVKTAEGREERREALARGPVVVDGRGGRTARGDIDDVDDALGNDPSDSRPWCQLVISGSYDHTIRAWDVESSNKKGRDRCVSVMDHGDPVQAFLVLPPVDDP
ncbi:hypothetical protein ACHAW5_003047 [Stephanodiscus triporus]|uniref:Peroxin-7 n=1 Tax=Stephanodiscus triporus TaxID=2934178 RepID=A0ABD3P171_9STRA